MRNLSLLMLLVLAVGLHAQRPKDVVVEEEPARSTLRARVFFEDNGRPVRRASVMIISENERGGPGSEGSGMTDDQGNLVVKGLKAGKYFAIINLPGIVTPMAYIDLGDRRANLDGAKREFQSIDIDGLTDAFANIGARRGGAVSGRVMYSDGDPASGVKVEVLRKTDDNYNLTFPNFAAIISMMAGGGGTFQTDDRGVFRVTGLPAGQYIVKVSQNAKHTETSSERNMMGLESMFGGGRSMINVFFDNVYDKDDARVLDVGFGQEIGDVNIVLPERGYHTISGKVVASRDKLPIRNAKIAFEREGDVKNVIEGIPALAAFNTARTDDEGKFSITDLPRGKYRMTVTAEGSELDPVTRTYGPSVALAEAYGAMTSANSAPPPPPRPGGGRGRANTAPKPDPPKFAGRNVVYEVTDQDIADQTIELNFGGTISGTVEMVDRKDLPSTVNLVVWDETIQLMSEASVGGVDYEWDEAKGEMKTRTMSGAKEFKIEGIAAGKSTFSVVTGDDGYYVRSATAAGRDLLTGTFNLSDGEVISNVRVVIANDAGVLKGIVVDEGRQPIAGIKLEFIPTESEKMFNSSYARAAVTDKNGEFTVSLPPMEFAILFERRKKIKNPAESRSLTIGEVKEAQKVKVDAKGTATVTVKYTKPGQN